MCGIHKHDGRHFNYLRESLKGVTDIRGGHTAICASARAICYLYICCLLANSEAI